MASLLGALRAAEIDFTFIQISDATTRMQGLLKSQCPAGTVAP